MMNDVWYDKDEDILNISLKEGDCWKSVEVTQGIVIDIAKDGSILSIEIPGASKVFSNDARRVIEKSKQLAS